MFTEIIKRFYKTPQIEQVNLDNEISLALESMPPTPENEGLLIAPKYFNNDPFKMNTI